MNIFNNSIILLNVHIYSSSKYGLNVFSSFSLDGDIVECDHCGISVHEGKLGDFDAF